jgi:hypothetical protein
LSTCNLSNFKCLRIVTNCFLRIVVQSVKEFLRRLIVEVLPDEEAAPAHKSAIWRCALDAEFKILFCCFWQDQIHLLAHNVEEELGQLRVHLVRLVGAQLLSQQVVDFLAFD